MHRDEVARGSILWTERDKNTEIKSKNLGASGIQCDDRVLLLMYDFSLKSSNFRQSNHKNVSG
jgi:hypothetical protein